MGKHLQILTIEKPCTASWQAMRGTDKVRHCLQCHLDVFDLSAMSEAEAEALVAKRTGGVCFRFTRRADGTVLTQDCAPVRSAAPTACKPRGAVRPGAPPMAAGFGLEPDDPAKPPVGPDPMDHIMMGAPPPPEPLPPIPETALSRDIVLAEMARAIRAHASAPERAEALVRGIERMLLASDPARSAAACPSCSGPMWVLRGTPVSPPAEQFPDETYVEEIANALKASFADERVLALLREVGRVDLTDHDCPHCHGWLSLDEPPPPTPVVKPGR